MLDVLQQIIIARVSETAIEKKFLAFLRWHRRSNNTDHCNCTDQSEKEKNISNLLQGMQKKSHRIISKKFFASQSRTETDDY